MSGQVRPKAYAKKGLTPYAMVQGRCERDVLFSLQLSNVTSPPSNGCTLFTAKVQPFQVGTVHTTSLVTQLSKGKDGLVR